MNFTSLSRFASICFLIALTGLAIASSEKQIYGKFRAHLRKAHSYRVDVWKLDEKGKKPQFVESVLFDSQRGFRTDDKSGPTRIGNKIKVWTRGAKVAKRTPDNSPDYLELYVGKDRIGPTSFGEKASLVTFDGVSCYVLSPMYGEHITTAVTLYVNAKTFLLAGYSESFQGNWSDTYSFRSLRLDPKTRAKDFAFPK